MKIFAATERLYLRELLTDDLEGMFALDSDREVHRFLGNQPITDKAQALAQIHFIRQQYVDYGIGRWAIIRKADDAFMGWAGLKFITEPLNGHQHFYDLGYRILRQYWGQGVATACAKLALKYAFEVLKLQEVFAIADCNHARSNKILQNCGLELQEAFLLEGVLHNWYQINRAQFKLK